MDIGAIEVLFTWQALMLAVIVTGCTYGVKALLDVVAGGTEKRKKNVFLTRLLLPAVPVVLGALGGAFIPIQPQVLIDYATERGVDLWAVGAPWGFVIGIFSDYLYSKIFKRIVKLPAPGEKANGTG